MNILITGSTGFIGPVLCDDLKQKGHQIYSLSRKKTADPNSFYWNPTEGIIELDESIKFDAVIHLAGEGIAAKRWSNAQKTKIRDSRVLGTKLISKKISEMEHKPSVLISASAIGFFGDRADEDLTESSSVGNSFLAEVCQEWENSTATAESAGIRVVHARLGIVLDPRAGALNKMLLPFKLCLGGVVGSGKQYWSWVALEDVIEAISFLMDNQDISGPVNIVSPQPVTNKEFTKILGKVLHRPTIFPMPAFVAKTILGEMGDALLLCSAKVLPEKLVNAKYNFKQTDLKQALTKML